MAKERSGQPPTLRRPSQVMRMVVRGVLVDQYKLTARLIEALDQLANGVSSRNLHQRLFTSKDAAGELLERLRDKLEVDGNECLVALYLAIVFSVIDECGFMVLPQAVTNEIEIRRDRTPSYEDE